MAQAMMHEDVSWERGKASLTHHSADVRLLTEAVSGAKSVLEFGPGGTTDIFINAGVPRIVTCEYIDKWLQVAKERFKDVPSVAVFPFTDTFPVDVPGLGHETFDVGFVDAPKGYMGGRHVHKGFEDCSRLNTVLFALERCKVVYLHDAIRPLERGTLARLHLMGYKHEFLKSPFGLARITKREESNGPNSPHVA
jgi:predicted O-methyltransferase YrrM